MVFHMEWREILKINLLSQEEVRPMMFRLGESLPVYNDSKIKKLLELPVKRIINVSDNSERMPCTWARWCNNKNELMAAAPNIYYTAKHAPDELLAGIREDIEHWIRGVATSTQIRMGLDHVKGVSHYVESAFIESNIIRTPSLSFDRSLKDFLDTDRKDIHLEFLQAIFGTEDEYGEIAQTLEHFTKSNRDRIRMTKDNDDHPNHRLPQSLFFTYINGMFGINFFGNVHNCWLTTLDDNWRKIADVS